MQQALREPSIRRTVVNAALSLDRYGVSFPQRFYAPLMVVWNFTYRCNLRCRHCYQNAGPLRSDSLAAQELTLEEKLAVVDQIAGSHIPTVSFSGGEPLIHPDFWPVAERARDCGLYLSINSNGTLITEEVARRLEEAGIAYAGISLDAPSSEEHDAFRGVPGAYQRTIQGIRNLAATKVATVLSFTITRRNYRSLPEIFRLAEQLGMDKVMVYNFVPTGRGREMIEDDMTPEMREEALEEMYRYAAAGGSLCTTAPQLGRVCKQHQRSDLIPLAHTGPGRVHDLEVLADLIGGCGVGRAYCALQPDGRVTPCVYMPDVTIGHVRDQSLLRVWQESPLLGSLADRTNLQGHCGGCEFREVCGGCRARAHAYFGDFRAPDPGCINNAAYYQRFAIGVRQEVTATSGQASAVQ
jgi:radical SAM protein with 4Fe4S-binding SPASM domain